jgi:hypothetical protein
MLPTREKGERASNASSENYRLALAVEPQLSKQLSKKEADEELDRALHAKALTDVFG